MEDSCRVCRTGQSIFAYLYSSNTGDFLPVPFVRNYVERGWHSGGAAGCWSVFAGNTGTGCRYDAAGASGSAQFLPDLFCGINLHGSLHPPVLPHFDDRGSC